MLSCHVFSLMNLRKHLRKKQNIFVVSCFDDLYDLHQPHISAKSRQEYSIYDLGEII